MGIDYSYILVIRKPLLDRLLRELANRLWSVDADRLRASLPWRPNPTASPEGRQTWVVDEGIADFHRDEFEIRFRSYCVCLMFPLDDDVKAYIGDDRPPVLENGKARVGCVWTSVAVDEDYAKITFTAATSGMSRLFESSAAVRDVFRDLARSSDASCLLLDREEGWRFYLVHPDVRVVEGSDVWVGSPRSILCDAGLDPGR